MLPHNIAEGRLAFTTSLPEALEGAEVVFIAVGTPPGEDGAADLQHVEAVARSIGQSLESYKVLVVKSTVPVGTCERVHAIVSESSDSPFDVVSNPEFFEKGSPSATSWSLTALLLAPHPSALGRSWSASTHRWLMRVRLLSRWMFAARS